MVPLRIRKIGFSKPPHKTPLPTPTPVSCSLRSSRVPGMCLQFANQGEKYEDHRETPFQVGKMTIDMGFQMNHGNGSTHGEVSISASGTAVRKHMRKLICFSQENTWFKVHKNESVQNILRKLWNPCQHVRAFLATCFGIFDKSNNRW